MNKQHIFGQGNLSIITNYVYWFMLTNVYFIFCNLIFLFAFMSLEPVLSNMILIFFALIPTGPAITALSYVMDKLIREKEIAPTRDFFQGYKINFKDTMKVWLPMLAAFFILIIDLQYFYQESTKVNQVMGIVFLTGMILLFCVLLYVFPITAKFSFRMRDVFKLSVYYSFKKIKVTTGNIGILIIALFLMLVTTDFLFIFTASMLCFFLSLNSKDVMDDIEQNYIK